MMKKKAFSQTAHFGHVEGITCHYLDYSALSPMVLRNTLLVAGLREIMTPVSGNMHLAVFLWGHFVMDDSTSAFRYLGQGGG